MLRVPAPDKRVSVTGSANRKKTASAAQAASATATPSAVSQGNDDYDLDARSPVSKSKRSRTSRPGAESSKRSRPEKPFNLKAVAARLRQVPGSVWACVGGGAGVLLAVLAVLFAPNGSSDVSRVAGGVAAAESNEPVRDAFGEDLTPFLKAHCLDCHTGDEAEAGLNLAAFDTEESLLTRKGRQTWEKILAMVEIGAMPPPDADQPSTGKRSTVVAYLEDKLHNLDCEAIKDPGRVTVRRLNKVEYNNTVRDLLGVVFEPAADFPSDDVGYGFDNIGDVLSISPLLMEKYLDAAEQVAEKALPVIDPGAAGQEFSSSRLRAQGGRQNGRFIAFSSRGHATLNYDAPRDGEYVLRIQAMADQHGPELAKMQVSIDGRVVKTHDVTGRRKEGTYELKTALKRGRRQIRAAFINDFYEPNKGDRNLYVGPFELLAPVSDEERARVAKLITTRPDANRSVGDAASAVLKPIIDRAFRRPVTKSRSTRPWPK